MSRPALFLDRDGVINVDYGYVHKNENFEFIDGIFELVRAANQSGYLVVVVTNQAGIGRGYYSENEFLILTEWMKNQFALRNSKIDAVYYCPHHALYGVGPYKTECQCRKPKSGMFLKAINDLNIDVQKSIMVGNSETDLIASSLAGVSRNIFLGNLESTIYTKIRKVSDASVFLMGG